MTLHARGNTFERYSTKARDACHSVARAPEHPHEHPVENALVATGMTKSFFGNTVLDGRRPDPARRRGPRPRRRERRRQVDAHEDARRRLQARQRHDRRRRRRGVVQPPGPGRSAPASSTVFQEFNLLPERTIAENICLGREPRRFGLVDRSTRPHAPRHRGAARPASASPASRPAPSCAASRSPSSRSSRSPRRVSFDAKVIQMDEPTAALADHEVELLYSIIRRLTDRGVAILYVSHRLKEIFDLCDDHHRPQGRRARRHPAGRRARPRPSSCA